MRYSIDKEKVTKLLFSKLKECNEAYLSVDEWLYNSDEYQNDDKVSSCHVDKILLKGQMQAIREEINKIQNLEG